MMKNGNDVNNIFRFGGMSWGTGLSCAAIITLSTEEVLIFNNNIIIDYHANDAHTGHNVFYKQNHQIT